MASKKERPAPPRSRPATKPQTGFTVKPKRGFTDNARADVSAGELRKLISEAAYYRAKQRGFAPGHELEDWIQAEAEVMGRIGRSP